MEWARALANTIHQTLPSLGLVSPERLDADVEQPSFYASDVRQQADANASAGMTGEFKTSVFT